MTLREQMISAMDDGSRLRGTRRLIEKCHLCGHRPPKRWILVPSPGMGGEHEWNACDPCVHDNAHKILTEVAAIECLKAGMRPGEAGEILCNAMHELREEERR